MVASGNSVGSTPKALACATGSLTPSTNVPDGTRKVPRCSMSLALINSAPPADKGVALLPLGRIVTLVDRVLPEASLMPDALASITKW
ncbi:hypothetical protein DyAD56_15450 [Dyella sp. AD56]|nr:hypothetical protein DyAD56_15450 [Dyella sp. AD56]